MLSLATHISTYSFQWRSQDFSVGGAQTKQRRAKIFATPTFGTTISYVTKYGTPQTNPRSRAEIAANFAPQNYSVEYFSHCSILLERFSARSALQLEEIKLMGVLKHPEHPPGYATVIFIVLILRERARVKMLL